MKVAVGPDQLGKSCRENVLVVNMDRLEDGLSRRCLSNKKDFILFMVMLLLHMEENSWTSSGHFPASLPSTTPRTSPSSSLFSSLSHSPRTKRKQRNTNDFGLVNLSLSANSILFTTSPNSSCFLWFRHPLYLHIRRLSQSAFLPLQNAARNIPDVSVCPPARTTHPESKTTITCTRHWIFNLWLPSSGIGLLLPLQCLEKGRACSKVYHRRSSTSFLMLLLLPFACWSTARKY